jgi:hypothetical protein
MVGQQPPRGFVPNAAPAQGGGRPPMPGPQQPARPAFFAGAPGTTVPPHSMAPQFGYGYGAMAPGMAPLACQPPPAGAQQMPGGFVQPHLQGFAPSPVPKPKKKTKKLAAAQGSQGFLPPGQQQGLISQGQVSHG